MVKNHRVKEQILVSWEFLVWKTVDSSDWKKKSERSNHNLEESGETEKSLLWFVMKAKVVYILKKMKGWC